MEKNKSSNGVNKKINLFAIALTIIALATLVLETVLIVHAFRILNGQGPFTHPYYKSIRQKNISVENIQGWMTFDFINKSFKLPPEYLKTKLNITDKKYPNISINHWAKENREDHLMVVGKIQKLILDYQNTNLNPSVNAI